MGGVDMVTIFQVLPSRAGLAWWPCGSGWNENERDANPRSRATTGASFMVGLLLQPSECTERTIKIPADGTLAEREGSVHNAGKSAVRHAVQRKVRPQCQRQRQPWHPLSVGCWA